MFTSIKQMLLYIAAQVLNLSISIFLSTITSNLCTILLEAEYINRFSTSGEFSGVFLMLLIIFLIMYFSLINIFIVSKIFKEASENIKEWWEENVASRIANYLDEN